MRKSKFEEKKRDRVAPYRESGFKKKMRARLAPYVVYIICLLIGVALIFCGLWISVFSSTFLALGVSILAGALINLISALRKEQEVNWTAFERAYYESITIKDRIRYNQRIEIKFEIIEKESRQLMRLYTTHSFDYINQTRVTQKCHLMKLFNDYHPPTECQASEFFKCKLTVGTNEIATTSEFNGGKMGISIDDSHDPVVVLPREHVHIFYEIESVYSMHDRLIWAFQEISDGATIAFDCTLLQEDSIDKVQYVLNILHPETDDITAKHMLATSDKSNNSNKSDKTKFITEDRYIQFPSNTHKCELDISNIILPYQGFEISWDLKNVDDSAARSTIS